MEILKELEKLLGITFTESFLTFWANYVPGKTQSFQVQKCKLNGPFGRRTPRPNHPNGWLIQIEEHAPYEVREVSLAHEIMHLALDLEEYSVIVHKVGMPRSNVWGEVASNLHSVLVHPIIWFRMREFGFPVDDHIRIKSTGQLSDVQRIHEHPSRNQFPDWENWLLRYILARLEWGEPERQGIFDVFANRHSAIGRQGEKYLQKLYSSHCYSEPQKLTPQIVTNAGEMLLQRLNINSSLELATIKTVRPAC